MYNWKQPVAYFVSGRTVKYSNLKRLLEIVLSKLFVVGLNVRAFICDQSITNQQLFKSIIINSEKTYFTYNSKNFFVIHDILHMGMSHEPSTLESKKYFFLINN